MHNSPGLVSNDSTGGHVVEDIAWVLHARLQLCPVHLQHSGSHAAEGFPDLDVEPGFHFIIEPVDPAWGRLLPRSDQILTTGVRDSRA